MILLFSLIRQISLILSKNNQNYYYMQKITLNYT